MMSFLVLIILAHHGLHRAICNELFYNMLRLSPKATWECRSDTWYADWQRCKVAASHARLSIRAGWRRRSSRGSRRYCVGLHGWYCQQVQSGPAQTPDQLDRTGANRILAEGRQGYMSSCIRV